MKQSARYLDARMREIRSAGKVIGADRIAVMAALNIAHEMLSERTARQTRDNRVTQLSQRVDALIAEHAEIEI